LQVLGWQTALVSTSYSAALALQGMIALNNSSYTFPGWHGALLTIGAVLVTIVFNTVLLRRLPMFAGVMLIVHVFAFLAIFVVLWVMGDKAPVAQVFIEFDDPQGWGSVGASAKNSN
jgi:choline transport protein